jgi:hypothetical protein
MSNEVVIAKFFGSVQNVVKVSVFWEVGTVLGPDVDSPQLYVIEESGLKVRNTRIC